MKPPLSIDEQINLLIERGLIADYGQLKETLNHISYYKLSGYFYIYQDKTTNQFKPDTDFRDIINLYNFDQELRKILLGYLHIIEISLASQISNHFCNKFQTSTPYLDNNILYADDKNKFDEFLCSVKRKINAHFSIIIRIRVTWVSAHSQFHHEAERTATTQAAKLSSCIIFIFKKPN